eukprot:TRINITY_DN59156_c0_g1_i1.p1 TRINITY_DN59156_c0_g1~~TRINITY_DN59156_c0_g1_i1.p1  ORF type:complete len:934 (+),score=132.54 TRINITY_DN59156_c0_g1_i1:33-2804(+)
MWNPLDGIKRHWAAAVPASDRGAVARRPVSPLLLRSSGTQLYACCSAAPSQLVRTPSPVQFRGASPAVVRGRSISRCVSPIRVISPVRQQHAQVPSLVPANIALRRSHSPVLARGNYMDRSASPARVVQQYAFQLPGRIIARSVSPVRVASPVRQYTFRSLSPHRKMRTCNQTSPASGLPHASPTIQDPVLRAASALAAGVLQRCSLPVLPGARCEAVQELPGYVGLPLWAAGQRPLPQAPQLHPPARSSQFLVPQSSQPERLSLSSSATQHPALVAPALQPPFAPDATDAKAEGSYRPSSEHSTTAPPSVVPSPGLLESRAVFGGGPPPRQGPPTPRSVSSRSSASSAGSRESSPGATVSGRLCAGAAELKCYSCSYVMPPDAKFCRKCGTASKDAPSPPWNQSISSQGSPRGLQSISPKTVRGNSAQFPATAPGISATHATDGRNSGSVSMPCEVVLTNSMEARAESPVVVRNSSTNPFGVSPVAVPGGLAAHVGVPLGSSGLTAISCPVGPSSSDALPAMYRAYYPGFADEVQSNSPPAMQNSSADALDASQDTAPHSSCGMSRSFPVQASRNSDPAAILGSSKGLPLSMSSVVVPDSFACLPRISHAAVRESSASVPNGSAAAAPNASVSIPGSSVDMQPSSPAVARSSSNPFALPAGSVSVASQLSIHSVAVPCTSGGSVPLRSPLPAPRREDPATVLGNLDSMVSLRSARTGAGHFAVHGNSADVPQRSLSAVVGQSSPRSLGAAVATPVQSAGLVPTSPAPEMPLLGSLDFARMDSRQLNRLFGRSTPVATGSPATTAGSSTAAGGTPATAATSSSQLGDRQVSAREQPVCPPDFDPSVWAELPMDMRQEISTSWQQVFDTPPPGVEPEVWRSLPVEVRREILRERSAAAKAKAKARSRSSSRPKAKAQGRRVRLF